MDLLSQYKQDHPEAFRDAPKWQPPKEYGFFIRLVMRLSGGKIRDINKASYALAIAAAVVFLISLLFFFGIGGFSSSPKAFAPGGYDKNTLPR